jgi:cyclomaltodextrinase
VPIDAPDWVADTVFYQVFPDRFAASNRVVKPGPLEPWDAPPTQAGYKGGDLVGLAGRLDELTDLGISGLYLNPIFSATSNHRYNAYDYLEVDPLLGGEAAFR